MMQPGSETPTTETHPEFLDLVDHDRFSALDAAIHGDRLLSGCVTAGQIARHWKPDADLVVLSACETGLGRNVPGEGYIEFAHAFFQAGARSLLCSLWKVEDQTTSLLMRRFYENLRSGGRDGRGCPKAVALQRAKRWLRRWRDDDGTRPYEHPYFRAGFVLVGGVG